MSASNLNANFDCTCNHTLKSNSKEHKKALPVWKSLKHGYVNIYDGLYGQMFAVGEITMLVGEDISQLIG